MRQPTHLLYMSNRVLKLHRNIYKINNFIDSIPPNDFIMIEYVLVNNRWSHINLEHFMDLIWNVS